MAMPVSRVAPRQIASESFYRRSNCLTARRKRLILQWIRKFNAMKRACLF